jgi:tetratricopeptide (TPR) repeat protein
VQEMGTGNTNWKKDLDKAVALHKKAINGDKQAAQKAYETLKNIKLQVNNHSLVEAYFGSSSALIARDSTDLIDKTNYAIRGMKALDQAIKLDGNNVEIRMLRGNVAHRLPEAYFKRTKTAIEDFQYLIKVFEGNNRDISKEQYYEILLKLGAAYKTVGNSQRAEETWNKLLSLNNSKYKTLVEKAKSTGGE